MAINHESTAAQGETPTQRCALCTEFITESTNSREHIIPAAIGGHHSVRSFICDECNNVTGEKWDAQLAAQLNWFSIALGVRRERGDAPRQQVVTTGGKRYWLGPNGSMESAEPPVQKVKTDAGHEFRFSLSNRDIARRKLEEIARKYPQINPHDVLATAQTQIHFVDEPIHIDFQLTEGSMRSIVKTALAYAFDQGVPVDACEIATRYLRSDCGDAAWSAYYERDLVVNRPARKITHAVTICANSEAKTILAYVEYFSAFRYVIILSQTYSGPTLQRTFAFDPVTWQSVQLNVDLALSAEELARVVEGKAWTPESMKVAFDYTLPIALQALEKQRFDYNIAQAIRDGFEAMGVKPGGTLPVEKNWEFSVYVSRRIAMYVTRMGRRTEAP